MNTQFTKEKNDTIHRDGSTEITLKNFRGEVTLTAQYPDNIQLIDAFATAMQKHSVTDIVNHLQQLA